MLGQQLINAIVLGSMYALTAVGFTLYFGVLNLINLAHGGLYMLGAFISLTIARYGAAHAWPAVLNIAAMTVGALLCTGLIGMAIEKVAVRPVRRAPALVFLITSVAVYIVIEELVLHFYPDGANPQVFPDLFGARRLVIGDSIIGYAQICLIAIAILAIVIVHLLITRTSIGRQIRAVTADPVGARMMAINVDRTVSLTFFIGSALAAVGGIMDGVTFGSVMFNMGFGAAIKGFTAAVIGGLGNIYGAMAGGYLLGLFETLIAAYVPEGGAYKNVITFGCLILCLTFRPSGLIGAQNVGRA